MPELIILGVKATREQRLQWSTYREFEIEVNIGVVDDILGNNLQYYLTYLKEYSRVQETLGRVTYRLRERNGKGLAEVCVVMDEKDKTRVEVDTFPIGSSLGENKHWNSFVFKVIASLLEPLLNKTERKRGINKDEPIRPSEGASREEWFEYKYRMGRRFTHKELAKVLNLSDHVRHLYALWLKEREEI